MTDYLLFLGGLGSAFWQFIDQYLIAAAGLIAVVALSSRLTQFVSQAKLKLDELGQSSIPMSSNSNDSYKPTTVSSS